MSFYPFTFQPRLTTIIAADAAIISMLTVEILQLKGIINTTDSREEGRGRKR
ncbi:MAG: hypothetical protein M3298_06205 [Thermoproteota archaeon]|nr:hypothetical protein [Thermoproteota archaeon]